MASVWPVPSLYSGPAASMQSTAQAWNAAFWVLPLLDGPLGLQPSTVWHGGPYDGLGFSLDGPSWRRSRWYTRVRVDALLDCARNLSELLADRAELRLDGHPAPHFDQTERIVRQQVAPWVVD